MSRNLVMILAGGKGERLYPLTRDRAKPAVPIGGKYRIIDFVLSNFVNSGFFRIKVLTQFKSDSLIRHLSRGWRLSPEVGHFVDPVPAQMRTGESWYKGTADAIFQNLDLIQMEDPDFVLIFGGDHVYRMDVRQMLEYHKKRGADLTVAAIPVPLKDATSMGVIQVDGDWRIIGWEEKPDRPKSIPARPGLALASMGNYILNRDVLFRVLLQDAREKTAHDFGKNIIPGMVGGYKVFAYDFSRNEIPGMDEKERGYWRDVGTIDAYYESNMDLVSVTPQLNLYNRKWPLRTYVEPYPPAKFIFSDRPGRRVGRAHDSLVCDGCVVSGGLVRRSVLSPGVRINSYSEVSESILMEGVEVGRKARVRRAIVDKDVAVPPDAVIGFDGEEDRRRFTVTESGIVVVPKGTKFY